MLMLRPAILKSIPRSCVHYSTRITPKEAAGPFTGNNQISRSVPGQSDKTLVYISPMVHTLQRYKMATSVFAGCGLFAVPAIGFMTQTQAPMGLVCAGIACLLPSVVMHMLGGNVVTKLAVHDDIKTVERQRRHPREINNDKLISIETCNILGRFKQTDVPLSAIRDVTIPSSPLHRGQIVWQYKRRTFRLERAVIQADPFLQGLAHRCIRA
ncbi:hypothetical protein VTP01DRAFT_10449 [Rhizomucor pusillus]|uniref:uncharacterized protein n=1 Tax=Rhizomucor pusillus TaxID=4840 RepID=UPI0037444A6A